MLPPPQPHRQALNSTSRRCQRAPGRAGQSLVEFALVFPLLLLLIGGGGDLARVYFVGIEITDGARQAALYASDNAPVLQAPPLSGYVPGTGYTTAQLTSIAQGNAGSGVLDCPAGKVSVTATVPPATSSGFTQTITVVCSLPMLTPFLPTTVPIRTTVNVFVVPTA